LFVEFLEQLGNVLPQDQWGAVADYNRIVGGLRISQERSKYQSCHYTHLHEFYTTCHPIHTSDKDPFGSPECNDATTVSLLNSRSEFGDDTYQVPCYHAAEYAGAVDFYHNEGFSFDSEMGFYEM
jgi:hypothetical protein